MPRKKAQPVTGELLSAEPVQSIHKSVYVQKSYTSKVTDTDYAKVEIGVTMPFNPSPAELRDARKTIKITSELVEVELMRELDALQGAGE